MDIFDQISQEACKAGEFIVKKANQAKDYTVATWNAAELRSEIEKRYKAIGKAIYRAHTEEVETAEEIQEHIEALEELHARLRDQEEERQTVRNRKLCPACDKPIAKDAAFCPYCGTQVK
ncbi:MAG: zinc-ribbon domain-containing protein [Clostridia bacterium]|nr:zinc-ribbon domain-containing protein [Clostridia bacterium]